jgi:hypothetical protein
MQCAILIAADEAGSGRENGQLDGLKVHGDFLIYN